jgi:hypothetical protein
MTTCTIDLIDVRLVSPPRKRQRGGEWDWFNELTFGDQQFCRRHMAPDEMTPDDLARITGLEIDEACRRWLERHKLESVTGARQTDQTARADISREDLFRMTDLLAPDDIAEILGVKPATIRQWLARGLLPAPIYVNRSGRVRLWSYDDIYTWAKTTGRMPTDTREVF